MTTGMSLRRTGHDGVKLVTTELRITRVVPVAVQLIEPVAVAVLPANVVEATAVKEILQGTADSAPVPAADSSSSLSFVQGFAQGHHRGFKGASVWYPMPVHTHYYIGCTCLHPYFGQFFLLSVAVA